MNACLQGHLVDTWDTDREERAGQFVLHKHAEDTEHGKAAVGKFLVELVSLSLAIHENGAVTQKEQHE